MVGSSLYAVDIASGKATLTAEISGIEGIRNISSSSRDAFGWISIEFELDRDVEGVAHGEVEGNAAGRVGGVQDGPVEIEEEELHAGALLTRIALRSGIAKG